MEIIIMSEKHLRTTNTLLFIILIVLILILAVDLFPTYFKLMILGLFN